MSLDIDNSRSEFWLAIIAGLTVSLGLAPGAYYVYFDRIGWPHPYITHYGPLWATLGGDLLCLGNLVFLGIAPIITWLLAAKHLRVDRDFFS